MSEGADAGLVEAVGVDVPEFARTYEKFMQAMMKAAQGGAASLTPLGQTVRDFLGVEITSVDPVTEHYPAHQVVDLDFAAQHLVEVNGGELVGITGADRMHIDSFQEFLLQAHWGFETGPVSYTRVATGPRTDRRVVSIGLSMLRLNGTPLVALHRGANPRYGRDQYTLEVLCPDPAVVDDYLRLLAELMTAHSVLRGQVISFQPDYFDRHNPGSQLRFLERPEVSAAQVILPDGSGSGSPATSSASAPSGRPSRPPVSTSNEASCSTDRPAPGRRTWSGTC